MSRNMAPSPAPVSTQTVWPDAGQPPDDGGVSATRRSKARARERLRYS